MVSFSFDETVSFPRYAESLEQFSRSISFCWRLFVLEIAAKLTITTLDNYENIKPIKQNESEVSFCKKIKKDDGLVNFLDAKILYLKYKAYSYWPGIFLESELKLKDINLVDFSIYDILENFNDKNLEISKNVIPNV